MIRLNSPRAAWQLILRNYGWWRCRLDATSSEASMLIQSCRHLSSQKTSNKQELKTQFIDEDSRLTVGQRLKNMIVLYGPLGTAVHICLSLSFLGTTYLVVAYGIDVPMLMMKHDWLSEDYMRIIANGGNFGLAYAIYKGMMPIRALITIGVTPHIANKLQAAGLIKKRF